MKAEDRPDLDSTRLDDWSIRDTGDDYNLLDPYGSEAGTLRRDLAEFVVKAVNYYAKMKREVDDHNRESEERRAWQAQLERDGIGGARKGDKLIVKTSKGPYEGTVRDLYHYTGRLFVAIQFKKGERRPAEREWLSMGRWEGVNVEASAIIRNITAEERKAKETTPTP